jgi:hypothetical protein
MGDTIPPPFRFFKTKEDGSIRFIVGYYSGFLIKSGMTAEGDVWIPAFAGMTGGSNVLDS